MSFPIEKFKPEVQVLAKQLRANPDWILYPTDDFFEEKEKFKNHPIGDYWRRAYGFMERPMTVKRAVEEFILGRYPIAPRDMWSDIDTYHPTAAKHIHEGLWPETELAAGLLGEHYTLDAREAARHISDKYTGPRE